MRQGRATSSTWMKAKRTPSYSSGLNTARYVSPSRRGTAVLSPTFVYSGRLYSLMLRRTPPGQSGLSISNHAAFSRPKSTRIVPGPLTATDGASPRSVARPSNDWGVSVSTRRGRWR